MGDNYIHHYTDISSLAMILDSKKIRFTRQDLLDDVSEEWYYGVTFKLSQYLFISCWTKDDDESIPQWAMYAKNMTGIRISMPKDMFKRKHIEAGEEMGIPIPQSGDVYFSFHDMYTRKYSIIPMQKSKMLDEMFFKEVCYKDNIEEIREKYKNTVEWTPVEKDRGNAKIGNLYDLAKYKINGWSFQNEVRFVLWILEAPGIAPESKEGIFQNMEYGYNQLLNNIPPPFTYFYMALDEDKMKKMKIMLGPKCGEGEKKIVELLLQKHFGDDHTIEVLFSKFHNLIR